MLASFLATFLACSEAAPERADSEGDQTASLDAWSLSPTPDLVIGAVSGAPESLLSSVRHATVLSDGVVVIGQWARGLFELRYYDASGRHLTTVGRAGEGPWEAAAVTFARRLTGDSLLVMEDGGKFSVFGPRGERVREGRHPLPFHLHVSAQPIDEARVLMRSTLPIERATLPQPVPDYWHVIVDLPSGTTDSIAAGPGNVLLPFASLTRIAAGDGTAWIGRPDRNELRSYAADGTPMRTLTGRAARAPVAATDLERHRAFDLSHMRGAAAAAREETYRTFEAPDSMPAFLHLQVDREGRLWVLRYRPPWSADDGSWDVYDETRGWVATVRQPRLTLGACPPRDVSCTSQIGSRILEIGGDYMLVLHRDDLGVASVRRYPLLAAHPLEDIP